MERAHEGGRPEKSQNTPPPIRPGGRPRGQEACTLMERAHEGGRPDRREGGRSCGGKGVAETRGTELMVKKTTPFLSVNCATEAP